MGRLGGALGLLTLIGIVVASGVSCSAGSAPATRPAGGAAPVRPSRAAAEEPLDEALSQGRLDDALRLYRQQPTPDRLTRLGEALKRAGRGLEMLELYQAYLLAPPGDTASERSSEASGLGMAAQVLDALVAVDHGEPTAKLLSDQLAQRPREPWLHLRLGYLLWRMQRHDQALAEFERYAALGAPSASWLAWVGSLCRQAGLNDEAVAYYERALATPLTDEDLRAASMMSAMSRPPEELRLSIKARFLTDLAGVHRARQQWAQAEKCYLQVLDLKPPTHREAAEKALAEVWKAMGKPNPLIEQARQRVAAEPKDAEAHARLAKLLASSGQAQEALEHYRQAAALAPQDLAYRLDLADALAAAGQEDQALAEYSALLLAAVQDPPAAARTPGRRVSPEAILARLERFERPTGPRPRVHGEPATATAPSPARQDELLRLYRSVLKMGPPTAKWAPSEYTIRQLLERIGAILARRSDYAGVVALWLEHRRPMGSMARSRIAENLARLDSLGGLIAQLEPAVQQDPADVWGRFILGDLLLAAGRQGQAMAQYDALSRSQADNEVRLELATTYQRMEEYRRALAEYEAVLKSRPPGTSEHTSVLGLVAGMNLRLGNKVLAAEQYRQALRVDPLNGGYLRGLAQASGQSPASAAAPPTPPPDDAAALRAKAGALLAAGQYDQAAQVLQEFLARRPTHVETIALLGQTYLKAGKEPEAIAAFEKAQQLRRWTTTDYGVASELERLYAKTGAEDKLIALYAARRNYHAIAGFYRNRQQGDKYTRYLEAQVTKDPADLELRLYLAEDHLDGKRPDAARPILEKLRSELDEGAAVSEQRLADLFERLGEPAVALKLLERRDFSQQDDSSDWLGTRLMGLYARTGQLPKALEVCLIRLRNDPDGYRTLQIAQETVQYAADQKGLPLLEAFLKDLPNKLPRKVAERFAGAVQANLTKLPPDQAPPAAPAAAADPVAALKRGRVVRTPAQAGTLLDFLDALAASAGTAVDQSFRDQARRLPAPKIQRAEAPALELLAEALSGLPASLEFSQEGYWAVYEHGDKNSTGCLAASGGAIFLLSNKGVFRRPQGRLDGMGHLRFDPAVQPAVAGVSMFGQIVQAVDDRGRDMPFVRDIKPQWDRGQVVFSLNPQDPPAKSISVLRLRVPVAVCTKWATLEAGPLDGQQPVVLNDPAATVTVGPMRTVEGGGATTCHIPLAIKWNAAPPKDVPRLRFELVGADGKPVAISGMSGGGSENTEQYELRLPAGRFDPAQSRLVVRLPLEVQAVDVELLLRDVPILEPSR